MSQSSASRLGPWAVPPAGLFFVAAVAVLTGLGLLVLFSASQSLNDDGTLLLRKQLVWLAFAGVAGLATYLVDMESTRRLVWPFFGVALVLLVAVLVLGREINGARRWLPLGGMNLQVSEVGKIALVLALSHTLAANRRYLGDFVRGFVLPSAICALVCGLIIIEPDFGTAFLCAAVGGTLMFVAGVRLRFLLPAALAAFSLFAVMVVNDPVRLQRITAFLDVEGNKADATYQLNQGILAFGVGGVQGVGLGEGRQQMAFLPEAHTDFIFAIVGEELGFIFTGGVVLLFAAIFLVGLRLLRRAPNVYQYLLVLGALLFITLQAVINIGVVTGCLPTKGMSLPFISYGGSNLVFMFVAAGLVLNGFRSWQVHGMPRTRDL